MIAKALKRYRLARDAIALANGVQVANLRMKAILSEFDVEQM